MALAAIALMASACWASFSVFIFFFFPRVTFLECLVMSPGIGLSASAWVALFLKSLPFMRKGVAPEVVWLAVALQTCVALALHNRVVGRLRQQRLRVADEVRAHARALWMLAVMSVWWGYMSWIHYLLPRGSEHLTGGSVYADLPFHLNITTSFLAGCNESAHIFSSLMSSFYSGVTLAYPFLPDFYIAVLVAGGMTLRWALVSSAWLLLSSLFGLIHMFNHRVTGSVRTGMLSVWLTLFAGGIGGFKYVIAEPYWWTWDNLTNSKFMHGPDHVLYWVGGQSAYWFSLPAHILFPQRTVQHAYPLALSAMLLVFNGLSGTPGPDSHSLAVAAGSIVPLTPLSPGPTMAGADEPVKSTVAALADDDDYVPRALTGGIRQRVAKGASASLPSVMPLPVSLVPPVSPPARPRPRSAVGLHSPGSSSSLAATMPAPSAVFASYCDSAELYTHAYQMRVFFTAGCVTGLIPLMQPHSYVSIGIVILVAAGVTVATLIVQSLCCAGSRAVGSKRGVGRIGAPSFAKDVVNPILQWTAFGVAAFGTGLPQFLKHFAHRVSFGVGTRGNGFVRLSTAWSEEGKGETALMTWWKALGFFVPAFAFSFLLLRDRAQRAFYVGFAALFIVCNHVMFQPWHLDNTKLFYVWVFGASGFVGLVIDRWLRLSEWAAVVVAPKQQKPVAAARRVCATAIRAVGVLGAVAAFIALTFSGALATWREMLNYAKLYDDIDFDLAAWIKAKTPTNAVFLNDLTQTNHIRIESSLAGRQVAHGFAGWLHSHGIDSGQRRGALVQALRGEEGGVAALGDINVTHITVDAGSKNNFDYAFLDDVADFKATNGKFSIYEVLPVVRRGWPSKPCMGAALGAEKRECLLAGCWFYDGRPVERRCVEKPRKREVKDCMPGVAGVNSDSCRAEGCVWVKDFPGPWCQTPSWKLPGNEPEKIPRLRSPVAGSDW